MNAWRSTCLELHDTIKLNTRVHESQLPQLEVFGRQSWEEALLWIVKEGRRWASTLDISSGGAAVLRLCSHLAEVQGPMGHWRFAQGLDVSLNAPFLEQLFSLDQMICSPFGQSTWAHAPNTAVFKNSSVIMSRYFWIVEWIQIFMYIYIYLLIRHSARAYLAGCPSWAGVRRALGPRILATCCYHFDEARSSPCQSFIYNSHAGIQYTHHYVCFVLWMKQAYLLVVWSPAQKNSSCYELNSFG